MFVCNEKCDEERNVKGKRKSHKQKPSICSKLFEQLARLSIVELKDGLIAGFLEVSKKNGDVPFYIEDVWSGLLNSCTVAAAVLSCNHDTQTKLVRSGSLTVVATAVHSWSHDTPSKPISPPDLGIIAKNTQAYPWFSDPMFPSGQCIVAIVLLGWNYSNSNPTLRVRSVSSWCGGLANRKLLEMERRLYKFEPFKYQPSTQQLGCPSQMRPCVHCH